MVKLDANVLRYMSKDEWRVLTAVEMGQKNHELVPTPLICRIAGLKTGGAFKVINSLHKNKLLFHQSDQYDGYRLTYMGYDYLALKVFVSRGVVAGLGRKIGVGKVISCPRYPFRPLLLSLLRLIFYSLCDPSPDALVRAVLLLLSFPNSTSPPLRSQTFTRSSTMQGSAW
jgi:hypothetical protein